MLTSAIMKAMDSAEIVIFLNTSNSALDLRETISKNGYDEYTLSPWIYEEILLTTLIRETDWEFYRKDWRLDEEAALEHFAKSLRVKYKLPKEKLIPLSLDDIDNWYEAYEKRKQQQTNRGRYGGVFKKPEEGEEHPLNILYELKCGVDNTEYL